MTRVVGVHGVWNFRYHRTYGPAGAVAAISRDWANWLTAGLPEETSVDLTVGYYAHHLDRGISQGADDDPALLEPGAQDMFVAWAEQFLPAAHVPMGRATVPVRQAFDFASRRFGGVVARAAVAFVREAHTYIARADSPRRHAARETVAATIAEHRPRIVIAHSLGSVVTYEALWAHPELNVDLLLTLGSPLGMSYGIFERLRPAPLNGRGGRPPGVARWVNLADVGDVFAIPRDLPGRFDGIDHHSGRLTIGHVDPHTVKNYLACPETIQVILPELSISS